MQHTLATGHPPALRAPGNLYRLLPLFVGSVEPIDLPLMPTLRTRGAVPPSSMRLPGVPMDSCTFALGMVVL